MTVCWFEAWELCETRKLHAQGAHTLTARGLRQARLSDTAPERTRCRRMALHFLAAVQRSHCGRHEELAQQMTSSAGCLGHVVPAEPLHAATVPPCNHSASGRQQRERCLLGRMVRYTRHGASSHQSTVPPQPARYRLAQTGSLCMTLAQSLHPIARSRDKRMSQCLGQTSTGQIQISDFAVAERLRVSCVC